MRFLALISTSLALLLHAADTEQPPSLSEISAKIPISSEETTSKETEVALPIERDDVNSSVDELDSSTSDAIQELKQKAKNPHSVRDELDIVYDNIISFERRGISLDQVSKTPDPFAYEHTALVITNNGGISIESFEPVISAILEHRAKVGTLWLKEGETYEGWKLVSVGRNGVWLESPTKERRYYPINKSKVLKVEKR